MSAIPTALRRKVNDRDQGRCVMCGLKRPGIQQHHRRPRGHGGSDAANVADNLISLCPSDHRAVESNRSYAFVKGWLVPRGHVKPWQWPVLTHLAWEYLLPDGTRRVAGPREGPRPPTLSPHALTRLLAQVGAPVGLDPEGADR